MDDTIRRSGARWWVAGALLVVALGGAALAAAGVTIWVLAAAAALSVAAAFRSRPVGVAAGVVVPLVALAFAVRAFPKVGLGLAVGNVLVLTAVVLIACVAIVLGRGFRVPSTVEWWGALAAAVVPAVVAVVFSGLPLLRGGQALSWAMQNDAVWNLVASRFLIADDGLIPSLHPNVSPLVSVMLAAGMAPGRPAAGAPGMLQHDIAAMAGVFAASTVVTAFLAGLVAAQLVRGRHPVLRSIAAVVASALILSWFVAGFSIQFGFYNVMPTLACLFAAWLAWRGAEHTPVASVCVLLLAATALLALWAFLAVIPLVLAAVAGVRWLASARWRGGLPRGIPWSSWAVLALAALQLVAYVLVFSIPDLRREQSALAQGGSMAPVTPALLFTLAGVALALAAVTATSPGRRSDLLGVLAIVVPAVGVYVFLARSVGPDQYAWGYYPAKLVWFIGILLLVILLGMALDRLVLLPLAVWTRVTAVIGVLVAVISTAAGVLPKPPTLGALVPYTDIVHGQGVAAGDAVLPTLFALKDPTAQRTMLAGYFDWKADAFADLWLLGAAAKSGTDPIRGHSYALDTDDREQVCAALKTWGPGVVIRTRDAGLEAELQKLCPGNGAEVVVGPIRSGAGAR
ncbi:hypothetical protein [Leifsonia sp. fls2-241-R2A-40a]|uniref:hypothetical protein n=1 Tax=Leifsonia sp. fls2-241-R2A-40a TaxID=3040290 RepID=UPI0025500485|nr:hypothetical protein [Leifsonia sp. fls2-241-R2A-40a]